MSGIKFSTKENSQVKSAFKTLGCQVVSLILWPQVCRTWCNSKCNNLVMPNLHTPNSRSHSLRTLLSHRLCISLFNNLANNNSSRLHKCSSFSMCSSSHNYGTVELSSLPCSSSDRLSSNSSSGTEMSNLSNKLTNSLPHSPCTNNLLNSPCTNSHLCSSPLWASLLIRCPLLKTNNIHPSRTGMAESPTLCLITLI